MSQHRPILLIATLLMAARTPAEAQPIETLRGHKGSVHALAYTPDGRVLVSAGADHTLRFWRSGEDEINDGEKQRRQKLLAELDDDRFAVRQNAFEQLIDIGVAIKPELLATIQESPSAEVRFRASRLLALTNIPQGIGHREEVRDLAMSPDGKTVVSASRDNVIGFWSIGLGRATSSINGHADGVWSVAFSPDGRHLASGGGDHLVKIWNVKDRVAVAELKGHEGTVHDLAYSPDGKLLASAGGFDRTVRVWSVEDAASRAVLGPHTDAVMSLAFSTDGRTIACGAYDGRISLWNTEDGKLMRSFAAHQGVVRDLAFSRNDKNLLISVGDDRTAKRWNVQTGEIVQPTQSQSDGVCAVIFSPDGKSFVTAGRDGIIHRWPTSASY